MIEYIEYRTTEVESVVEISCLDGFFMVPSHDTVTYTCQPEGSWNLEEVQCLRRKLLKFLLLWQLVYSFYICLTIFFSHKMLRFFIKVYKIERIFKMNLPVKKAVLIFTYTLKYLKST